MKQLFFKFLKFVFLPLDFYSGYIKKKFRWILTSWLARFGALFYVIHPFTRSSCCCVYLLNCNAQ